MWPLERATGKEVQGGGQYRENLLISLGARALQRAEKGLKSFVGDANSTLSGKIAIQPRPEIDFARQNRTQPLRKEKAKGGGTCLVGLDSAHRTEAVFLYSQPIVLSRLAESARDRQRSQVLSPEESPQTQ